MSGITVIAPKLKGDKMHFKNIELKNSRHPHESYSTIQKKLYQGESENWINQNGRSLKKGYSQ